MDKQTFIDYCVEDLRRTLENIQESDELSMLLDARCKIFRRLNHIIKGARVRENDAIITGVENG
jgi:hypothetical protein